MNSQEAFVLVMVLLAFSAYGWGVTLVHLSTRFRWLSDRPVRLDPALNIALGVALFLAVGGLFVAVNLAYIGFLIGWQILGAVLCAASIFRRQLWTGWKTLLMPRLIPGWIAILIVLYMSLGPALCGAWNANDDGGGYIYLGQRLLATGGLIDPFNTRRLNSYGGAELFQAIIGRTVGTAAGIGVEWFLFLLLTIALLVRSIRRRGAAIVLLTIGFGIALIRPVGEWANVAPSFSGVALTLAAARLISEYRSERNSRWVFLLAGLLFGALFSLRLEFTVAGGIMVFLSLFSPRLRGQRFSLFACTVIGSACALCGWAVALERSSGTPLFPLFKGNWTQASWFVDPQLHSLTQHLNETGLILRVDRIGVGLFGALIATVVVAIYAKKIPARAAEMAQEPVPLKSIDVSLALIFGCLALVLSQAYVNSGSTFADIGRYVGPSILACVLFSVSQVWDLALVLQTDRSNPSKTFGPRLVAVTFAICGIVFALL